MCVPACAAPLLNAATNVAARTVKPRIRPLRAVTGRALAQLGRRGDRLATRLMKGGVDGGKVLVVVDDGAEQDQSLLGWREKNDAFDRGVELGPYLATLDDDEFDGAGGCLLVVLDEEIVGVRIERRHRPIARMD